jgi:predicted acyl esterase
LAQGQNAAAESGWPQWPVWLGQSMEPTKSTCADEFGKWVAEDGAWRSRVKEKILYLGPDHRLGDKPADATYSNGPAPVLDTVMLETSSWGECGNDDLPGDQAPFDKDSLYFDSEPLPEDFDCFGYPEVVLGLSSDRPLGSLCIRLNEISPETGTSHLVSYRFYNLADRGGNMDKPERVQPGARFSLRMKLNLMGHTFKKGWRVRLALSPSFIPRCGRVPSR